MARVSQPPAIAGVVELVSKLGFRARGTTPNSYVMAVLLHEQGCHEEARQYIQQWREAVVRKNRDAVFLDDLEMALGLSRGD